MGAPPLIWLSNAFPAPRLSLVLGVLAFQASTFGVIFVAIGMPIVDKYVARYDRPAEQIQGIPERTHEVANLQRRREGPTALLGEMLGHAHFVVSVDGEPAEILVASMQALSFHFQSVSGPVSLRQIGKRNFVTSEYAGFNSMTFRIETVIVLLAIVLSLSTAFALPITLPVIGIMAWIRHRLRGALQTHSAQIDFAALPSVNFQRRGLGRRLLSLRSMAGDVHGPGFVVKNVEYGGVVGSAPVQGRLLDLEPILSRSGEDTAARVLRLARMIGFKSLGIAFIAEAELPTKSSLRAPKVA